MPDYAGDATTELERKITSLRWVCLLETGLFVAMWLCIFASATIGVALLGSLHGMAYLAYAAMCLGVHRQLGWSRNYLIAVVVAGPIGALVVYERLRRPVGATARTPAAS